MDLIKREDAIQELAEYLMMDAQNEWAGTASEDIEDWKELAETVFDDIPSKQEWIPCSERLPDLEEYVLVTLRHGETMIMALDWDDGKIEWKTQEKSLIYDDEEVIAWMPLPPVWEGTDNE